MGHWLTKSQCNLLIADKHKAEHTGIFEINSILKSWFISVSSNIMATLLQFSAEYVGEGLSNRIFLVCCFTLFASARWLKMHVEAVSVADLLGEQKWMWKLNHSLNCTTVQRVYLAVTLVRQGGGWSGVGGVGWVQNLERTDVPLCLFTLLTVHAAYELLGDSQNKALAIKRQISPTLVFIRGSKIKKSQTRWICHIAFCSMKATCHCRHEALLPQALHWQHFKTTLFCFSPTAILSTSWLLPQQKA